MRRTYRESWFKKFSLNSILAERLFDGPSIYPQYDGCIVLQFEIFRETLIIAELIKKEDFEKYTEKLTYEQN